jgi:thiamine-monophosphate kinase
VDEAERIARVLAAAAEAGASLVADVEGGGPGDDAARLGLEPGHELVWTVDDHVEGVHFRAAWGLTAVGRKAAGAALSDVAATAGKPLGVLLSLVLPLSQTADDLEALARGVGQKLAECSCALLGGNVTRGGQLSLSISAVGAVPVGRALRRDRARLGDRLYVTGPLGLSRLGLAWLEAGGAVDDLSVALALRALLDPAPRFDVAEALRGLPVEERVAGMDLSDGLAVDLPRLLRASGVAARVDSATLPTPDGALAARVQQDPLELAWLGGEDYELLLAAPPGLTLPGITLHAIGEVIDGPSGQVELTGSVADKPLQGFDPFQAPGERGRG